MTVIAVGDGQDLLQLVGDEHDRRAGLGERSHDPEQLVDLLRGEHRGRLVEDKHARRPGRSALRISTRCWTPTGRSSTRASGSDLEAESARRACRCPRRLRRSNRPTRLRVGSNPSIDVLRDGEHGHEHEVLVHHADAGRDRLAGVGETDRLAVERISPASGCRRPKSTFISVVFPRRSRRAGSEPRPARPSGRPRRSRRACRNACVMSTSSSSSSRLQSRSPAACPWPRTSRGLGPVGPASTLDPRSRLWQLRVRRVLALVQATVSLAG